MLPIVPIPTIDVSVREATAADIPFIDALQKTHSRMVGFMKTKALEGKIAAGEVLIGEDARGQKSEVSEEAARSRRLTSDLRPLTSGSPVGYVIGTDRYFKHDDVGIIYQLNVAPGRQRGFVGATLLKAMFDRAAYGCRLFCCWCAQDIEANRFWEAMGFVPLAYRAGSERRAKGGRVHIFWQKRIRSGDSETPWWFPSRTTGGALSADRLVLPIPPGTHWSDAKPLILPGQASAEVNVLSAEGKPRTRTSQHSASSAPHSPAKRQPVSRRSGLSFAPTAPPAKAERRPTTRERKPKAASGISDRPRAKNDPRLVAAARELKDRWLERVNAGEFVFETAGKYDVARILPATPNAPRAMLALPEAA